MPDHYKGGAAGRKARRGKKPVPKPTTTPRNTVAARRAARKTNAMTTAKSRTNTSVSSRRASRKTTAPSKKTTGPLAARSYRKTKGGDFPVYKKSSPEAGSFRSAFSKAMAAKKAGKDVKANKRTGFSYDKKTNTFTHKGRKYKAVKK